MLFSSVPVTRRCRGDTRDRLREAGERPEGYRPGADQLTSERIKPRSLRLLAEHDQALNRKREHPPRTRGVRLPATRHKPALFIKDCQRAIAIACIGHLSEERPDADSLDNATYFKVARRLRR